MKSKKHIEIFSPDELVKITIAMDAATSGIGSLRAKKCNPQILRIPFQLKMDISTNF